MEVDELYIWIDYDGGAWAASCIVDWRWLGKEGTRR